MGGDTAFGGSRWSSYVQACRHERGALRLPPAGDEQDVDDAEGAAGRGRRRLPLSWPDRVKSAFGGNEVVCLLERDGSAASQATDYRLVATSKTGTLQKELGAQAGAPPDIRSSA